MSCFDCVFIPQTALPPGSGSGLCAWAQGQGLSSGHRPGTPRLGAKSSNMGKANSAVFNLIKQVGGTQHHAGSSAGVPAAREYSGPPRPAVMGSDATCARPMAVGAHRRAAAQRTPLSPSARRGHRGRQPERGCAMPPRDFLAPAPPWPCFLQARGNTPEDQTLLCFSQFSRLTHSPEPGRPHTIGEAGLRAGCLLHPSSSPWGERGRALCPAQGRGASPGHRPQERGVPKLLCQLGVRPLRGTDSVSVGTSVRTSPLDAASPRWGAGC